MQDLNLSIKTTIPIILLLIGGLFLSILSGIFAAFGNVYFLIALLALYGFFFVIVAPVTWIVWIIFLASFLITGPVAYFMRFSQLQWLAVLVSAALLLPLLLYFLRSKTNILSTPILIDLLWPIIFILSVIFSTVIDNPQFADFVNASRHYLLMWPLMLVFMFGLVHQEMIAQLWKALMIVAVLQLPMAIYQYFFVAKESTRVSPWDAVIGTFHGNIDGGGESHGMAIMLLIAMLTAIALWHGRMLHGKWMSLVVVMGLGTLALAEVKAVILLLPIAIILYYYKELLRRPVESIVVVIGAFLLIGGLFAAYEKLHYTDRDSRMHTFNTKRVTSTYDRVMRALSPDAETDNGMEIGRVNHIVSWWNINVNGGDLQHSLFGYGMGATSSSRIGAGELVNRFPYQVNISSTTVLLWETGIVGHLIFLIILLSGARNSADLAKNEFIPEIYRIFLRIGAISLLLLVITLPYRSFHFYSIPIQFLIMLMLGQAAYWLRLVRSRRNNLRL